MVILTCIVIIFLNLGSFVINIHSNMVSRHPNYQNVNFRHLFVSTFENSWLFCFLSDNDDSNLIGLLVHSLIVENFINIYFLKNNGTMWQTVHLRFTYFTLFDLTILTFIFCPNIILWVDVKITPLSIQSSLTLLRLFTAEEKSWLSLLF